MLRQRFFISIIAVSLLAIGAAYLFSPELLLAYTGGFSLDDHALIDVRATYGGIQLAIGAFLLIESRNATSLPYCLKLLAWSFASVGFIRVCTDLTSDLTPNLHFYVGVSEIVLAVISYTELHNSTD